MVKVNSISLLLDRWVPMEEFKELEKKLIILSMKVNLKMISIMDMEDISMLMVVIILEIGLMERDRDGVSMSTNLERFRRECGNILNLWVTEIYKIVNFI